MTNEILLSTNPNFSRYVKFMENHMSLAKKSKATIKSYVSYICRFIKSFNRLPQDCSKNEIIEFLLKQKDAYGLKYSTIKSYVSALRYYFYHVMENTEFALKIPSPKVKDYDIEVLTIKEMHRLFEACSDSRQSLIIQILYETGIRVGELSNLKIDHFDFNLKTIFIYNGKRQKSRTIYFGSNLESSIKKYLTEFPILFSDSLFSPTNIPFIPLSSCGIQRIVKNISLKAKIKKKISPHSFRHTFAVHYLNFGGSLFSLQRLLGHSRIRTTFHYIQYATLFEGKKISVLDSLFISK